MVTPDYQQVARKILGDRPEGVSIPVYRTLASVLAGLLNVGDRRRDEIEDLRKRLEALETKGKSSRKGGTR